MSEPSVPFQSPRPAGESGSAGMPSGAPAWVRPTLLFLLGVLLGAVVLAASRPMSSSAWQPVDGRAGTSENANCNRVIADAQEVAELARRAASAAQRQDATSRGSLVGELNRTESTLDVDATGCRR